MSSRERIRVMVVDDHSIMRVGLKQVLEQSGEFEVVGDAADGEEAVRVAAEVSPDVVVMDVMIVSNQQEWDTLGPERSSVRWRPGELPEGLVVTSASLDRLGLHLLPSG